MLHPKEEVYDESTGECIGTKDADFVIVGPCRTCYLKKVEKEVRERYHSYLEHGVCFYQFPSSLREYFGNNSVVWRPPDDIFYDTFDSDGGSDGDDGHDESLNNSDDDTHSNDEGDCGSGGDDDEEGENDGGIEREDLDKAMNGTYDRDIENDGQVLDRSGPRDPANSIEMGTTGCYDRGKECIHQSTIFQKVDASDPSSSLSNFLLDGEFEIIFVSGYSGIRDCRLEWTDRAVHQSKSTLSFRIGCFPLDHDGMPHYREQRDPIPPDGTETLLHGFLCHKLLCRDPRDTNVSSDDYQSGISFKFFQEDVDSSNFSHTRANSPARNDKYMVVEPYDIRSDNFPDEQIPSTSEIRILDRRVPCRWKPQENWLFERRNELEDEHVSGFVPNTRLDDDFAETYGEHVFAFIPSTMDANVAEGVSEVLSKFRQGIDLPYDVEHGTDSLSHWIANHLRLPGNVCDKIRSFYAIPWAPPQPYFMFEKNDVIIRIHWGKRDEIYGSTYFVARKKVNVVAT